MDKRLLRADEIECRVGQENKEKTRYSVLLYKTARTDMAILDELYGPENWCNEYRMVGNSLYCRIGIRINGEWIYKESNGSESTTEAEKGKASDAFKRAGFMVGIGRELYSAPRIWLDKNINSYDLEVKDIGYNDKCEISRLVINVGDTVVFEFPRKAKGQYYTKPQVVEKPVETPKAPEAPKTPVTKPQVVESPVDIPKAPVTMPQWKVFWKDLLEICPDTERLKEVCKQNGCETVTKLNKFFYETIKRRLVEDGTTVPVA